MINASKEFKEKLKNGAKLANYADITLSDGTVLHLEPKDFMIGGCQIEDKTSDGKFGVGYCIGKTLKIRLENDDERFSSYDFYMATIIIYVAMILDDGTIEKIRKGKYYATVPQTQGDIIEISAVDAMYRLDRPYAATTVYPATLQSIISDICLECGIPAGFRQFDNYTYTVKEKPENLTYRQVLSYACQVAGYNARIDNDGYMQLIWYNTSLLNWCNYNGGSFKIYPHDTILDGGDFTNYGQGERISGGEFTDPRPEHIFRIKSLTFHTDDVVITGVKVIGKDDVTALFGEEGYAIVVKGNPFVDGKESEVAAYLGGRMVGIVFRPFSAQILGNPLYEPFETVMVSDRKGNVYNSIINSVSYKIGAYTNVSCQAEDPVRNGSEYISPAVQAAVAEARKNAEKQLTTYDKAVQQMNQLAMNSMGFHTTVEDMADGSRVVYLHDKPALEDSKTIYKQTIDGFFISTDGGKSYTSGFDKNGNVVVNVLSAIGVQADWIKVEDLTAFRATIAGWRINNTQIYKYIDIYQDMTSEGLSGVGQDDPVQYWCWMRAPVDDNTPVFGVYYKKKRDYLSSNDTVYPFFNVRTNGKMYAENAEISGSIDGADITLGGSGNNGQVLVKDKNNNPSILIYRDGIYYYKDEWLLIGILANHIVVNNFRVYGLLNSLEENGEFINWQLKEGSSYNNIIGYFKSGNPFGFSKGLNIHKDLICNGSSIILGSKSEIYESSGSNLVFKRSGNIAVSIGSSVNVYKDIDMNGNSVINTSDERLKDNIQESDVNALEIINEIKTYSFDWIETGEHKNLGFVAQQIETVEKSLVNINENDGHYSTKDIEIIPYLLKAVQELSGQVEEMKNEISILKGEKVSVTRRKKTKGKSWNPNIYTKEDKQEFVKELKKKSGNEKDYSNKGIIKNGT